MSVFDKIKHYKALKNGLKEGNNVTNNFSESIKVSKYQAK